MKQIVFKDKVGNILYKEFIKTRGNWRYFAKNRQGKFVNLKGIRILAKRGNIKLPKIFYKHLHLK